MPVNAGVCDDISVTSAYCLLMNLFTSDGAESGVFNEITEG